MNTLPLELLCLWPSWLDCSQVLTLPRVCKLWYKVFQLQTVPVFCEIWAQRTIDYRQPQRASIVLAHRPSGCVLPPDEMLGRVEVEDWRRYYHCRWITVPLRTALSVLNYKEHWILSVQPLDPELDPDLNSEEVEPGVRRVKSKSPHSSNYADITAIKGGFGSWLAKEPLLSSLEIERAFMKHVVKGVCNVGTLIRSNDRLSRLTIDRQGHRLSFDRSELDGDGYWRLPPALKREEVYRYIYLTGRVRDYPEFLERVVAYVLEGIAA